MHHTWRSRNDRKYSNHQELQSGCGLTGLTQRRYTHNGGITGTSRGYLFRKAEHHFKAWNFLVEAAQIVSGLRLSRKCVIRAWKLQIKGDSLFSVCVARLVIESNLIEEILSASGEHPSPSTETQTSPKQRKLTRISFSELNSSYFSTGLRSYHTATALTLAGFGPKYSVLSSLGFHADGDGATDAHRLSISISV